MNKNSKRIRIIALVLSAFVFLFGIFLIFDYMEGKKGIVQDEVYFSNFYEPNFSSNIFDDTEYLGLNRIISYKNGATTITVAPENYLSTDPILDFLCKFTDTIINGDYENYPKYFSKEYLAQNDIPEKFTMQRLYNITVEKISEDKHISGDSQHIYMLDYMINKNDGTFRRDMDSDASKPWYLTIITEDGTYKIDRIITYLH